MENEILPFGETIELTEPIPAWIPADPDDDVFIETAIRGNAAFLVSGDSHIIKKRDSLPCRILTLDEFLTQQAEA
jgi:predicted nucleic acid-binding protein